MHLSGVKRMMDWPYHVLFWASLNQCYIIIWLQAKQLEYNGGYKDALLAKADVEVRLIVLYMYMYSYIQHAAPGGGEERWEMQRFNGKANQQRREKN